MGSIKIYHSNYYFYGEHQGEEELNDLRAQAADDSINDERDVLLHLHPHSDKACLWDNDKHEVYREGKLVEER